MLLYFFNSTWHTADLKLENFMPTNNYKLRVWASEPHTMLMHYRSEPKTEYECRFSYYQIRIIWIESSCISEFRRRWSENFVPWHSRSHGARIQVPLAFINYIYRFLKLIPNQESVVILKSTQYKKLAPNALRFTYENLKSCKNTWKKWNKEHQTLTFQFFTNRFSILMFARFQIFISEPQSIWRKLLVLSWL